MGKGKIPKDLKRWLKDNGHFIEFIRLLRYADYNISDLTHKGINKYGKEMYSITSWFKTPIKTRYVLKNKKGVRYDDFLKDLGLNIE